jgi:quercetin dioxygenase-like cupin family protein
MMIYKNSNTEFITVKGGLKYKTLVHSDKTHMIKVTADKGAILDHSHPHEQTGYLLEGHLKLTIDNSVSDILPGDAWAIPGNTHHRAEILENSIIIEVFTPPREDYLKLNNEN